MGTQRKFKIVWAVDPLGEEKGFQSVAAELLRSIAGRLDAEVRPVYLYGGYPLEFTVYSPPTVTEETKREAASRLAEIVKDRPIANLRELEILTKPYVTLKDGVDHFVARAVELEADLVVATTHARKGVTRWLIGSFAEALTEKAKLPVLIVNPEAQSPWELASVVFATDFSEESKRAFCAFLPLARAFKSEICLYHKLAHVMTPRLEPAFSRDSTDWKRYEEKLEKCRTIAAEWARVAKEADVRVAAKIDPVLARTPADATIENAHERKAWIAIAARRGKVAATLLGSTARRILRNADVPVWVYRSNPDSPYRPELKICDDEIARDLGLRTEEESE